MKSIFRTLIAYSLSVVCRGILHKYRPKVIMVTGSVGKTSTKDALAAALSKHWYLRASEKSYNSEFGVPLTIIGVSTPWSNPFAWLKVYTEAFSLLLLPSHFPRLLVLEVGADRPHDLSRILRFVTPDVVVVTRLPDVPVHVEAYADPTEVREEEFAPAYALPHGAPLIMCAEDAYAAALARGIHATVTTYGYSETADVHIQNPSFDQKSMCMRATVVAGGQKAALTAPGVIGRQQLYAPAAAVATALALTLSLKDALAGIASYTPPPGRSRVLSGKEGSLLIDDSYNASPAAAEEALGALALAPNASRRIAVLGDMLELGRYAVAEHERIGALAAASADVLVTVGARSLATYQGALDAGMKEAALQSFATAPDAAQYLEGTLQKGDVVLIKGSQGMRMERITERLLHDPADIARLARQDKEWKKR